MSRKFKVTVSRYYWDIGTFEVEANSEKEIDLSKIDQAQWEDDSNWTPDSSEILDTNIIEIKEKEEEK